MSKKDVVIATRHKNIVEWLNSKGIEGVVLEVVRPKDVIGKTVYGVLPLYMVSMCKEFYNIHINTDRTVPFDDIPYSEFDNLGVEVKRYTAQCERVQL